MIEIYGKDGVKKAQTRHLTLSANFMQVATVAVEVPSATPIAFAVGDYFNYGYNGHRYTLRDVSKVKRQARSGTYGEALAYTLTFYEQTWELSNCPFLDLVPEQSTAVYSSLPDVIVYARPQDIVERIQANLDSFYGDGAWSIRIAEGITNPDVLELLDTYKDISLRNATCIDALNEIFKSWGLAWIYSYEGGKHKITVAYTAAETRLFRYGKGQGLRALTIEQVRSEKLATRIYAYGGTENMPARWYNDHPVNQDEKYIDSTQFIPNLMLPPSLWHGGKPDGNYVQDDSAVAKYGLRPAIVYFDGSEHEKIIPSIKGMTAKNIRDAKAEAGEDEFVPNSTVYPDDTRMDRVLSSDSTTDNGVRPDYEPYSERVDFSFTGANVKQNFSKSSGTFNEQGSTTTSSHEYIFKIGEIEALSHIAQYRAVIHTGILNINVSNSLYSQLSQATFVPVMTGVFTSSQTKQEYRQSMLAGEPIEMEKTGTQQWWAHTLDLHTFADEAANAFFKVYQNMEGALPGTLKIYIGFIVSLTSRTDIINASGGLITFTLHAGTASLARGVTQISNRFSIRLRQIGFDIMRQVKSPNENRTLNINSGLCAGYAFNILSTTYEEATDSWLVTCQRTTDTELKIAFPNIDRHIVAEDEFVITGIELPDIYVYAAMRRLYDAALRLLAERAHPAMVYVPEIDKQLMAASPQALKAGMFFWAEDAELGAYESILIDSLQISENGRDLPSFSVTLRNERTDSLLQRAMWIAHTTSSGVSEKQVHNIVNQALVNNSSNTEPGTSAPTTTATSASEEGEGNAITDIDVRGNQIVGIKGNTFVDLTSEQSVSGLKRLADIIVSQSMAIPQAAPQAILTGLLYMWLASTGNYPETPSGGVDTVYDLTLRNGQVTLGIYQPGVEPKSIDLSPLIQGLAAQAWVTSQLASYCNGGSYNSETKNIELKHDSTVLATIDARAFIKDGMVDSVAVVNGYLVITFNTDSGKEPIRIPTSDIFDANAYLPLSAGANKPLTGNLYTRSMVPAVTNATVGTATNRYNAVYAGAVEGGANNLALARTLNDVRMVGMLLGNSRLSIGEGYAENNLATYLYGATITFSLGQQKVAKWQMDGNGHLLPATANTSVNIGAAAKRVANTYSQNSDTQTLNVSGKSTQAEVEVSSSLAIPTSAPTNPTTGKTYIYIDTTGNYTE